MVWRVHVTQLAADVGIDAEDGATVNEDLCKDVEDTVVNLAGRRHQQCRECHDDARTEGCLLDYLVGRELAVEVGLLL